MRDNPYAVDPDVQARTGPGSLVGVGVLAAAALAVVVVASYPVAAAIVGGGFAAGLAVFVVARQVGSRRGTQRDSQSPATAVADEAPVADEARPAD